MTHLLIESCGPGTTIQDHGRFGWQRYGVGPAGAMDRVSLAMANFLVGNGAGAGGIEFALAGARLRVEGGALRCAVIGADLKVDGKPVAQLSSVSVAAGSSIEVGAARDGLYSILAVAGGFALLPQLGSLSLHMRAAIGGLDGRALMAGDRLALHASDVAGPDLAAARGFARDDTPIRILLGPQDDFFTPQAIKTLVSQPYLVTAQADRMGIRLSGPNLAHGSKGYNIVSDGIVTGSIQVPGAGEPIVLLADRQTTGGYPKIATIISADLHRIAQMRPGSSVRFIEVTRSSAVAALKAQADALEAFRTGLRPAGAAGLDSERLLGLSLVDGWVDAGDPRP
jgi:biotin-dependent carboxylase-like uncharacterized protein